MVRRMWSTGLASLAVVAVVALPAAVSAQDDGPPPAADYRSALMVSLQNHMSAVSALAAGEVAYMGHIQQHASAVNGLATMIGEAFPEGTAEGSRASEDIWANWDAFMEKLRPLQEGAAALDAAAQAGDADGIAAARQAIMGTCRSCHTDYRLPPPGN
ncbi:cytochrome c [Gemmatimonadota bacterium Y43]|uniref:c-type cytochrome n=2 Tax=Gaopeijia maritima TaxID=3119007 RepID=UPI0032749C9F